MKAAIRVLAVGAVLFAVRSANAQTQQEQRPPFSLFTDEGHAADSEVKRATQRATATEKEVAEGNDPGSFNGLGSDKRTWELQSDSTFSTSRTATQRFALGGIYRFTSLMGIVGRVDFGAAADTSSGFYSVQGPLASVGVRYWSSPAANHWLEFGARIIPGWSPGPNATDPANIRLALSSSLASGQADDARWLTFASTGLQLYLAIQSRGRIHAGSVGDFLVGAQYGGRTSLEPLSVVSWLGPQNGIVANAFAEIFVGILRVHGAPINLQVGTHGDASLSSVWPGNATFPVHLDGFLGWSPKTWIAVRLFYGVATVPQGSLPPAVPPSNPYGARLTFYVP
jgi:hypothetical protein